MTGSLNPSHTNVNPIVVRHPAARHRRQRFAAVVGLSLTAVLVIVAVIGAAAVLTYRSMTDDSRRDYLGADGWPSQGQAAISLGPSGTDASPGQRPEPIASMAKVMTAYVVLHAHPLDPDADGFRLRISASDEQWTKRERDEDQSVVVVRAGETLTQRQAMLALMLPSANNVAEFLARRVAGSIAAFVNRMNLDAARLGMHHTHYADPSGYDPATVSTASDQLLLARAMAGNATFTSLAATRTARIPVAGTIHNTDTLLGRDGFTGTKTGSHDAAGGCFMFRALRRVNDRPTYVIGVVMGQRGHDLVSAALYAATQLVVSQSAPQT